MSIPDDLYTRADAMAAQLGLNRSQLYARAVEEFLAMHAEDPVTEALNRLGGNEPAGAVGRAAGLALIEAGNWAW